MDLAAAERAIGYTFTDKSLLQEAFTHSTYAHLHGGKDNERLEYLGDAVLQFLVTEWQYKTFPTAAEGTLTAERQKLVCADALDSAVKTLGLQRFLQVEGGKSNVGKKTTSSIFEAVLAAIYLDGGMAAAKSFVSRHILSAMPPSQNPKGDLQEWLQARGEEMPKYTSEKFGKDNAPVFRCTARAMGKTGFGEGKNKKQAEQAAAQTLLAALQQNHKQETDKK